jgi:hypothetical protein
MEKKTDGKQMLREIFAPLYAKDQAALHRCLKAHAELEAFVKTLPFEVEIDTESRTFLIARFNLLGYDARVTYSSEIDRYGYEAVMDSCMSKFKDLASCFEELCLGLSKQIIGSGRGLELKNLLFDPSEEAQLDII